MKWEFVNGIEFFYFCGMLVVYVFCMKLKWGQGNFNNKKVELKLYCELNYFYIYFNL